MILKKIFAISVILAASSSSFADPGQGIKVVHVTPEFLLSKQGQPIEWRVTHQVWDYDIENETTHIVRMNITVGPQTFSDGASLMMSATDGRAGTGCGLRKLVPGQSIICDIWPGGHTEISYNLWNPKETGEIPKEISGTVVLSKTE